METQNFKGNNWSAKRVDKVYIVSIQNNYHIVETLTDFIKDQDIQAGEVTGIGAVSEATLRFFNFETKTYVDKTFREQMEVTSISGNVYRRKSCTPCSYHLRKRRLYRIGRTSFRSYNSRSRRIYLLSFTCQSDKNKG